MSPLAQECLRGRDGLVRGTFLFLVRILGLILRLKFFPPQLIVSHPMGAVRVRGYNSYDVASYNSYVGVASYNSAQLLCERRSMIQWMYVPSN